MWVFTNFIIYTKIHIKWCYFSSSFRQCPYLTRGFYYYYYFPPTTKFEEGGRKTKFVHGRCRFPIFDHPNFVTESCSVLYMVDTTTRGTLLLPIIVSSTRPNLRPGRPGDSRRRDRPFKSQEWYTVPGESSFVSDSPPVTWTRTPPRSLQVSGMSPRVSTSNCPSVPTEEKPFKTYGLSRRGWRGSVRGT